MRKILTVVGARPQFVKAAVVSRAIMKQEGLREIIVHTGQHFDENMSEVFFSEMEIPLPAHHLDINGLSHGKMTGRMMESIEEVVMNEKPDAVLVYGDTNSTLAGALVATKLHIPLGHVEAGLRSFNMRMPEEINRILTDRISKWLFCPTVTAVKNLQKEGYDHFGCEIDMVGDVMYDAALFYTGLLNSKPGKISIPGRPFILTTIHRAENTLDAANLAKVVDILNALNRETPVLLPLHPGTAARIRQHNLKVDFCVIEPASYFDMLRLLQRCAFVVTDSGGLQKEASFFNKYCLTLREQTEWTELVENNVNFVCGTEKEKVFSNLEKIKSIPFPTGLNLYGDGHAGEAIVRILNEAL